MVEKHGVACEHTLTKITRQWCFVELGMSLACTPRDFSADHMLADGFPWTPIGCNGYPPDSWPLAYFRPTGPHLNSQQMSLDDTIYYQRSPHTLRQCRDRYYCLLFYGLLMLAHVSMGLSMQLFFHSWRYQRDGWFDVQILKNNMSKFIVLYCYFNQRFSWCSTSSLEPQGNPEEPIQCPLHDSFGQYY